MIFLHISVIMRGQIKSISSSFLYAPYHQ